MSKNARRSGGTRGMEPLPMDHNITAPVRRPRRPPSGRETPDAPAGPRTEFAPLSPHDPSTTQASPAYREPRAIRVQRRGEQPFEMPIYADVRYSFGRERTCDVVFADDTISRLHGVLSYRSDGRWVYRDMGSSNGSWLSEQLDVAPELREEAERIHPSRGYVVAAGQSVVLANRAGRIAFLEELPESAARREAADRASPATEKLRRDIEINARHHMPVFLLGPTGSGKTWAARRIHEQSGAKGAFVAVNCGALTTDLNTLKSELLGHAKGAFSGAIQARLGKLHHARNGTLFLDEIESLHPEAQAFLLDLLDGSGNFAPLGAPADHFLPQPAFRLISASKRALRQSALREDLCNRLARGGIVLVPGLDARREDIPELIEAFVAKANAEQRMNVWFDPEAVALLQAQEWPDHVRGLEGVVLLLAELANAKTGRSRAGETGTFHAVSGRVPQRRKAPVVVTAQDVREHMQARAAAFGAIPPPPVLPPPPARLELALSGAVALKRPKDYRREEVEAALEANGGNLTHTARALGMVVNTLKSRMAELGLRRG